MTGRNKNEEESGGKWQRLLEEEHKEKAEGKRKRKIKDALVGIVGVVIGIPSLILGILFSDSFLLWAGTLLIIVGGIDIALFSHD